MKYIFFLFILLPSALYAQKQGQALPLAGQAYIDSLLQELPKAKEDTNKVILLYRISFSYHSRDTREGIKNGEKALALAEKLNWKKGLAYACNAIGLNYQNLDNNKALEYYLKGLKVDEELVLLYQVTNALYSALYQHFVEHASVSSDPLVHQM